MGMAGSWAAPSRPRASLEGDGGGEASVTIRVHPEWAPIGAEHFRDLVERGWYDGARVFRVVPGYVAQFGLPAEARPPAPSIEDDPVRVPNRRGTLAFATAGPNTRADQLFINLKDNLPLDGRGFSPFGEVVGDGMQVVDGFYSGYGEEPDQERITKLGNLYLNKQFPKLSFISRAVVTD
ncbi:unnamed protein product [Prorocentrum cordatum]|uniref:Peptidyl-prolyl cis-trans isomerase n=1 Tax=Prorocentrum cordatum TaxID=2364126 RepID=A0ABN9WQH9_9DINO|nr:unnamed protein product [Polarella glacialis]